MTRPLRCICGKEVEMVKELNNIKLNLVNLEEIWIGKCESCLRKYDLWVCNENLKYENKFNKIRNTASRIRKRR
ncbi:MAG: hypothetical protein Unbinned1693contig1002_27 [Prokaryotic dsDNA virus sp.]|jgi:hypothetical protein|nr:MAG: hypothetical protein Unbinned1693contig1002_27 [Prokaryotic dsDNA virus sp.]|tara:strand:+ start:7039 stop:7260 length:222 start_codon:yes stop_codon:yes gene_type:complete